MDNMDSWHSYPSVYALGHRAVTDLFLDPVLVEEKVDGSQLSAGRFEDPGSPGETILKIRSKGAQINPDAPEKMFIKAVEVLRTLPLRVGWTYRFEYLRSPKHNALAYDRIPNNHLIIFDINTGNEEYMPRYDKVKEADRLGLEVVPLIDWGKITNPQIIREMLDCTSILGGQKIEGVVVKNYHRFGQDKKVLMGKYVSEAFKEVHDAAWKSANPRSGDIIEQLVAALKTPARWNKAVQHLRDAGALDVSPKDIGPLMKEVHADIDKECLEMIAEKLMAWAVPKVKRGVAAGLPEWWKGKLLEEQFAEERPSSVGVPGIAP